MNRNIKHIKKIIYSLQENTKQRFLVNTLVNRQLQDQLMDSKLAVFYYGDHADVRMFLETNFNSKGNILNKKV